MKMFVRNILLLFFNIVFFYCLTAQEIKVKEIVVPLGEDTVMIQKYSISDGLSNFCYVHVHENEVASLEAGFRMIMKQGGDLLTLRHSKDGGVSRMISFRNGGQIFVFDPNRIFTESDSVLLRTIKSKTTDEALIQYALSEVKKLAALVWSELGDYSALVALHNNKNQPASCEKEGKCGFRFESESYSITSYVKKFDEPNESALSVKAIYINPAINNSEFFVVTMPDDFTYLMNQAYSVVLQNENPVDDGSMSVFAVKNKMRYINAEAKLGKVEDQHYMLSLLHDMLSLPKN